MFTGGGTWEGSVVAGSEGSNVAHLTGHLCKKGGRLGPGGGLCQAQSTASCTLDAGDLYSSSAISARLCLEWYLHQPEGTCYAAGWGLP